MIIFLFNKICARSNLSLAGKLTCLLAFVSVKGNSGQAGGRGAGMGRGE